MVKVWPAGVPRTRPEHLERREGGCGAWPAGGGPPLLQVQVHGAHTQYSQGVRTGVTQTRCCVEESPGELAAGKEFWGAGLQVEV